MTLARTIWLPDDGPRAETCRSVFNVLMCKFYICAVVGVIIEYRVFIVAVLMESTASPDWTEKLHRQLFDPLTFYAQKLFLYRCLTAL